MEQKKYKLIKEFMTFENSEVITTFYLDIINKNYIIYTHNMKDLDDNLLVYAAIKLESLNNNIEQINTDEEWILAQKEVDKLNNTQYDIKITSENIRQSRMDRNNFSNSKESIKKDSTKKSKTKRKKKSFLLKLIVFLFLLGLITIITTIIMYNSFLNHTGEDKITEFEILSGDTYSSISTRLEEENFITSSLFYKVYLKLNETNELRAGTHTLNTNMTIEEIINTLSKHTSGETYSMTFKEGVNMRSVIKTIVENTDITEDKILELLSDTEYLQSLIDSYWFITDDILNEEIYYSLEGYLYPNTYQFYLTDGLKDIFKKLLDQTKLEIAEYEDAINKSEFSFHEILTIASLVELEAKSSEDRKGVAGVFINRLNLNMSLGSDVTTYYAVQIDMGDRDLYASELNDYNAYNTRNSQMSGELPVSPICNSNITSIVAVLEYTESNDLYFVADKYGDVYFTKTYNEHLNIISQLKSEDKWFTYE